MGNRKNVSPMELVEDEWAQMTTAGTKIAPPGSALDVFLVCVSVLYRVSRRCSGATLPVLF